MFKRHLTAVHNVEQTPPNSRKQNGISNSAPRSSREVGGASPIVANAKCSICSSQFSSAQEFYEHLDDCVLNVIVPSTTPRSAIAALGGSTITSSFGGTNKTANNAAASVGVDSGLFTTPTTASSERQAAESLRDPDVQYNRYSRQFDQGSPTGEWRAHEGTPPGPDESGPASRDASIQHSSATPQATQKKQELHSTKSDLGEKRHASPAETSSHPGTRESSRPQGRSFETYHKTAAVEVKLGSPYEQ